ncbi:MAG: DNA polymerase III subunit gamma/tau [Hormoscilla sp. GM7CHS1pb]|nr:DNA polymerase III subunit gamma/tau [Hormoscilla sp. GM7CHS1pb]
MSYEPLHQKYRPQTFAQLVGQEAISTTLSNALRANRIAPAYLFAGPRGTGKTSSARILAKSLNCLSSNGPTDTPCGECQMCHTITKGTSLDVIEIDAASNTGVDNIRELIEKAQFAPVRGRYKVYIIDEIHMLSTSAFNAMLKTLEEPPERVVFVLATTDPQRVLPTIISRCQRFDFRRIPLTAMVKHLREIARKENIAITDEAITLAAQISQGGLRDAESLLDQLSLQPGEVRPEDVWDLVGSVPERDLLALISAIASDDHLNLLEQCRSIVERGKEPAIVLQNIASFYRDLLIAKTAPQRSNLVAVTPPTWKALCKLADKFSPSIILAGQKQLKDSEYQIKHTTQPRLWLEVTLLGLLPSALTQQPDRNSKQVSQAANKTITSSQPEKTDRSESPVEKPPQSAIASAAMKNKSPAAPTANPVAEPRAKVEPVEMPESVEYEQIWQQAIKAIEFNTTRALLSEHGRLLAIESSTVKVSISSKPLLEMVKRFLPSVEAAFSTVLQGPVTVKLVVASDQQSQVAAVPQPPSPTNTRPTTETNQPAVSRSLRVLQDKSTRKTPDAANSTASITKESARMQARSQEEKAVTSAAESLAASFGGELISLSSEFLNQTPVERTHAKATDQQQPDLVAEEDDEEDEIPF